jgi:predicted Zn-dependent protease
MTLSVNLSIFARILKKKRGNTMRPLFLFLAALVMALLSGCAVNPATGKSELSLFEVPASKEIAIGQKTFPQALQQTGGVCTDPQLNAYVSEVGKRLGHLSQRPDLPYQFRVVNDTTPNAFALPGGFIAITRGLLINLDNEAQLAAVLGHEVGHVAARHAVQEMQRGTLFDLALTALSGVTGDSAYGPLAQQAGELTTGLLDRSYSREQELEADRLGIDYMVLAGYNPVGAIQVQDFFYLQLEKGAEPSWLAGLFRTHPFSKERMLANKNYINSRYPQDLNNPRYVIGTQAFQAAIAPLLKTRKAYELYDQARNLEKQGALSQAIPIYGQAAAAAPEEPLILTGLGTALLKAEDLNSARSYLEKAVDLDGNYYYSRLGIGYVYLQEGETNRAVKELEASMNLLPTAQGGFLLAEGYEKAGHPQEALNLYRAVAQADPKGKLGQAAAARARAMGGR